MEEKKNQYKLNGKIIIAMGRAMQATHKESNIMLRENELTHPQFTAMEALYHKGDLTVQGIIDSVLSTSGNMTVIIRNLEQRGLVERIENPEDRRSFVIRLTDKGREKMNVVFPKHMELVSNCLEALSLEEKETVVSILRKIK